MSILVVEDEKNILDLITFNLNLHEYTVVSASNGQEALELINTTEFELIILDIMIPEFNGLEVLEKLRVSGRNINTPVLITSARAEEKDIIKGLELGADNYITKPFAVSVLIAKVKSILRAEQRKTSKNLSKKSYTFGDIVVDKDNKIIIKKGDSIQTTKKEFDLLFYLVKNKNKIISREELLQHVWGYDFMGNSRTLDVHIKNLRLKIEDTPKNPKYIKTKVGFGYILDTT